MKFFTKIEIDIENKLNKVSITYTSIHEETRYLASLVDIFQLYFISIFT